MRLIQIILIGLSLIFFTACSGKQLKKYGGNLAVSGSGNPIMAGAGLIVGGTIYSIGSLVDNEEENKNEKIEEKE